MPPVEAWDPIQRIRQFHDKGFYRWMPHINLFYPFYEDGSEAFDSAPNRAQVALKALEPFKLRLSLFDSFEHSPRSSTVWLKPEPTTGIKSKLRRPARLAAAKVSETSSVDDAVLKTLHTALLRIFPECTDLSHDPTRGITEFNPHLSVGGWQGPVESGQAMKELSDGWSPIEFLVDAVYLITRVKKSDPFTLRWKIPLGTETQKSEELNLRYVAAPDGDNNDDVWKYNRERPANRMHRDVDMTGLPWGLFPL